MNPSLSPEFITTSVWLWENFGKEFVGSSISAVAKEAQKQWQQVEWAQAAKQYRKRVFELYSTMRMLGNANPVSVEGIFTALYILDKPTAWRRYNIDTLRLETGRASSFNNLDDHEDDYRVNAVDWIKKHNQLFILGKPGAGKTTLMKYVTLMAAKGVIDKVPIFVSLNDWAQRKITLHDYIKHQFEICSFPDADLFIKDVLLRKGRALVVFDGLDEVNEENDRRQETIRTITDFTNQYSKNKFLITCRVAATDYSFDRFSYVEIADFTRKQIESFASKWFSTQPEKGKRFISELSDQKYSRLRELAQTPILLNLLCLSYDETLTFPPRLVDIYQEAIDALLKKWDASRNIRRDEVYHGLSSVRKQHLLAQIAAEYFEKGEIFFYEDDLTKRVEKFIRTLPDSKTTEVDASVVVKAMEAQHGILVERAHRIHSFSHLTFQEFFTSRYIIENYSDKQLGQIMLNLPDTRWHEIFIMSASLLSNADQFFGNFRLYIKQYLSETPRLKKFSNIYLSKMSSLNCAQRVLVFDTALQRNLSILQDVRDACSVVADIQKLIDKEDLKNVPIVARKNLSVFQNLYDKFSEPKGFVEYLKIPIQNLQTILFSLFVVPEDIDVRVSIQVIDKNLKLISKRFLEISYAGNADSRFYLSLEKERLNQLEKAISNSLNVIKENLEVINNAMGLKISSLPPHWPIVNLSQSEVESFIYLNTLLVECVNVAAVSDREKILSEMCLQ